jgi:AcrR family transcriptional regulator
VAADGDAGGEFDARLVTAALAVLQEHGLAGLTLGRLAERLGGSRMTLHRRGVTREDTIAKLAGLAAQEYRDAVWPALTSSDTAATRLERALAATCEVADRYSKLLVGLYSDDGGIFHDADRAEPSGRASAVPTREVFVEPLARMLRDGARDGSLACDDPDVTATVLFNQVGWTFLALRHGQRWEAERAKDVVVASAMASVTAGGWTSAPPSGTPTYQQGYNSVSEARMSTDGRPLSGVMALLAAVGAWRRCSARTGTTPGTPTAAATTSSSRRTSRSTPASRSAASVVAAWLLRAYLDGGAAGPA